MFRRCFHAIVLLLALSLAVLTNVPPAVAVPVGTTASSTCPPNSSSRLPESQPGCISSIAVRSTRGFVASDCILDVKALDPENPEYKKGECKSGGVQAEAIAQARVIAQLNQTRVHGDSSPQGSGITPNLQWEPIFPNVSKVTYDESSKIPVTVRPDLLLYDHSSSTGSISVAEIKLTMRAGGEGPDLALSQAEAYRKLLIEGFGKSAHLLDFNTPGNPALGDRAGHGFSDKFRVVLQECTSSKINYKVEWQYTTSATEAGVLMVDREVEQQACVRQPVPTSTPTEAETPVPEDIPQNVDWSKCMVNAGSLTVNAAEWLTKKSKDTAWALVGAPRVRELSTMTRLATAIELAEFEAALTVAVTSSWRLPSWIFAVPSEP